MWIEAGDLDQAELMLERAAEMAPLLPDQRWSHALTSAALAAVRGSAADLAEARALLAAIASDDRNPAATEIIRQLVDHGSGLDIPPVPPPNGSTAQGWARRILLSRTDATKGSQPR